MTRRREMGDSKEEEGLKQNRKLGTRLEGSR